MVRHPCADEPLTELLPSGNHRLVCDDCHGIINAATEDEVLGTPCRYHQLRQPLRYVYVLELVLAVQPRGGHRHAAVASCAGGSSAACRTCGSVAIAGEAP